MSVRKFAITYTANIFIPEGKDIISSLDLKTGITDILAILIPKYYPEGGTATGDAEVTIVEWED